MNLKAFDNKHAGQRGFVIGGGSSIKQIQKEFNVSLLLNEVTIGANKAYKLITPQYLVWGDYNFFRRFKSDLVDLNCTMFYGYVKGYDEDPPDNDPRFISLTRIIEGPERNLLPVSFTKEISFWQNSGVVALRIAYLLGCNPIYLLGIDLKNQGEDIWFHEGYGSSNGAGARWYEFSRQVFVKTIQQIKEKGVDVYSCSSISLLNDVAPFMDINNLNWI